MDRHFTGAICNLAVKQLAAAQTVSVSGLWADSARPLPVSMNLGFRPLLLQRSCGTSNWQLRKSEPSECLR
jgi:hypothetical protein